MAHACAVLLDKQLALSLRIMYSAAPVASMAVLIRTRWTLGWKCAAVRWRSWSVRQRSSQRFNQVEENERSRAQRLTNLAALASYELIL